MCPYSLTEDISERMQICLVFSSLVIPQRQYLITCSMAGKGLGGLVNDVRVDTPL